MIAALVLEGAHQVGEDATCLLHDMYVLHALGQGIACLAGGNACLTADAAADIEQKRIGGQDSPPLNNSTEKTKSVAVR
jgi:hypothetical protein